MGELVYNDLGDGRVEVLPQEINTEYRIVKSLIIHNTNGYEFRYESVQGEVLGGVNLQAVVEELSRDFKWLQESRKGIITKYPTAVKSQMRKELSQYIQPISK